MPPAGGHVITLLMFGLQGIFDLDLLKLLLFFRSKLQRLFGPVGIQLVKQKLQKPYTGQFESTNLKFYFWDVLLSIRHCDGSFLQSKE